MADRLPDQRIDDPQVRRNFDQIQLQLEGLENDIAAAEAAAAAALAAHEADTTSIHGIADTTKLVRTSGTGLETALRVIRGVITTTTPTTDAGSGFSVSRNGTGDVTISFSTAFASQPAVTFGLVSSGTESITITAQSASSVRVLCQTAAGAATDRQFHFIAIGPA